MEAANRYGASKVELAAAVAADSEEAMVALVLALQVRLCLSLAFPPPFFPKTVPLPCGAAEGAAGRRSRAADVAVHHVGAWSGETKEMTCRQIRQG